jgi:hypothetical protein
MIRLIINFLNTMFNNYYWQYVSSRDLEMKFKLDIKLGRKFLGRIFFFEQRMNNSLLE